MPGTGVRPAAVFGILVLVIGGSARAEPEPIKLKPEAVCVERGGVYQVSPKLLLKTLYTERPVSDDPRDHNGDGTISLSERIEFVFRGAQLSGSEQLSDSDGQAVDDILHTLDVLFGASPPNGFKPLRGHRLDPSDIPLTQDSRDTLARFWAIDNPAEARDEVDRQILAYAFLSELPGAGLIECVRNDDSGTGSGDTKTAGSGDDGVQGKGQFLLRGTISDLGKSLKKADPATISAVSNVEKQSESVSTQFVVGYRLESWIDDTASEPLGATYASILPFVGWHALDNSKDEKEVNNVTVGADVHFRALRGSEYAVWGDLIPRYTATANTDTQVASVDLEITPPFVIDETGRDGRPRARNQNGKPILFDTFVVVPEVTLVGQSGSALEVAKDSKLNEDEFFARVGGRLIVNVVPSFDTTLEHWTLKSTFQYLYGLAGEPGDAYNWTSRLGYKLSDTPYIDVGLSYQVGQAPDTFEDVEVIKLDLGWKF